jgi:nicotinamide mononucleotide adenylyltransferase
MEYLLAGKSRCEFLLIGITNPDPGLTTEHPADPKRSLVSSNPFTYFERFLMIRDSLQETGIKRNEFDIVPFPINYPERIRYYAPPNALYFATIYDNWGEAKVETLKSLGLQVEVMWKRNMSERFTTGEEVRRLIATGQNWENLVPPAVARIIKEYALENRVRELVGS